MESVIVLGLGEVGRPLYEIIRSSGLYRVCGYDIRKDVSPCEFKDLPDDPDYIHVTYPYSKDFVDNTLSYINMLRPKKIIIHSTVAPGTTRAIYEKTGVPTAYSPVRGKHPNLKRHMMFWPKWVSAYPSEKISLFADHLSKIGFVVKIAKNPETLELAKLFETAYRALMIAAWQEIHRLSRRYKADLTDIAEFIAEVHEVLKDRPVFYPDYIGGHCLIPNTEILDSIDPDTIWRFILESNRRRLEEIKEEDIKKEIEELKKISSKLIPTWYFT